MPGIKSTDRNRKDGSWSGTAPELTCRACPKRDVRHVDQRARALTATAKVVQQGNIRYDEVPDIPAFGESEEDTERPRSSISWKPAIK